MVILPKREQQPFSQYMADEIDKVEDEQIVENDLSQLDDTTDWKAKAQEIEQKRREDGIRARERTKALRAQLAAAAPKTPEPNSPKTGELDDNALDYLDLKGVSEAEDIKVIEDIVKKTGMTVRQALKDDYVTSRLTSNKQAREVKAATPSSTQRGASTGDSVEALVEKYERTKELPKDFDLRVKVVNALKDKSNRNKPSWQ